MTRSVAELISDRGGVLQSSTLSGTARYHLEMTADLFGGFLRPIIIPGRNKTRTATTPPSKVSQFEFVRRWTVNAFAANAEERPLIMFYAGTPFALFELFNGLLALPTVLPDHVGEEEDQQAISLFPTSFEHYENIASGKWPDQISDASGQMTYVTWSHYVRLSPRGQRRALIALKLYMDSIFFLFLHELGHIDHGHLEYLDRNYQLVSLAEFNAAAEGANRGIKHDLLQSLELQADSYAVERLVVRYFPSDDPYLRAFHSIDSETITEEQRYRLWLFSLGTLFLYLEKQAKKTGLASKLWPFHAPKDHPDSLVRLLNVAARAHSISDRYNPESGKSFLSAMKQMWHDLIPVAQVLGLFDEYSSFHSSFERQKALVLSLLDIQAKIDGDLAQCKIAVSERYYLKGRPVDLAEYEEKADPEDKWHLRGQAIIRYVNGKELRFPFLDERDDVEAYLRRAADWREAGLLDNALCDVKYVLDRSPENSEAAALRNALWNAFGEEKNAILEYAQAVDYKDYFADSLAAIGTANCQQQDRKQLEVGLKCFDSVTRLRPLDSNLRAYRGLCLQLLGNKDRAIEEYDSAIRLGLDGEAKSRALVDRGSCFVDKGDLDKALASFQEALELVPDNVYGLTNRAIAYFRNNRIDEALADFTRAIELEPGNAHLFVQRAGIWHGKKDLVHALADTNKAVELAPDDPGPLSARARIFQDTKRYEEAIRDLTKALELKGDAASLYYDRGWAKYKLKNVRGAIEDLDHAFALSPPWLTDAHHKFRSKLLKAAQDATGI